MTPALTPSGSVFLGNRSIIPRVDLVKRVLAPTPHPSRRRRDQKTFSAGPRSFSSEELWFSGNSAVSKVQPVVDSRHGRITYKASLSCVNHNHKESHRLQSVLRAQSPTLFLADGGSPKSFLLFHG